MGTAAVAVLVSLAAAVGCGTDPAVFGGSGGASGDGCGACPGALPCDASVGCCLDASDCSAAEPFCQVEEGRCRECLTDAHCDGGRTCVGQHCLTATCTSDTDCGGDDPRCDLASGSCRECLSDADCAGDSDPRCSQAGECVRCLGDEDCEGGQCEDNNCKGGG